MRRRVIRFSQQAEGGVGHLLPHRPDIDGLRAVAVLSVVLFHLDSRLVPGGYTGVDIFFVISGYLITSILRREIESGDFSFRRFYLRRIRRIAPAYFATTSVALAAGCLLLAPADLDALAQSALWGALALPNVHLWRSVDASYFAADSSQLPLLHLWSLGVEEQFYLIWPSLLLLGLTWFGRKALVASLLMLTAGSFHFAQQQSLVDPSFAYAMLPTRAGELGLGAIVALMRRNEEPRRHGGLVDELLALAGLLLLAAGFVLLDEDSRFPGWNALYPCVGTSLLIASGGRDRLVTAPLRSGPVVWIGLISYSLYLWHWPVLAFIRYFDPSIDAATAVSASALVLALSVASYYLIERPCRNIRLRPSLQPAVLYVLPLLAVVTATWAIAAQTGSASQRIAFAAAERDLRRFTAPAYYYHYNCQQNRFDPKVLERPECVHGSADPPEAKALLWGDSHAAHYIGVVATIAESRGFRVRNATLATCPPILNLAHEYGGTSYRSGCSEFRRFMTSALRNFDLIFLGAQWSAGFRENEHLEQDLRDTLGKLSRGGKTVILLGQVPEFPSYDRACEMKNLRQHVVECRAQAEYADEGMGEHNRMLERMAARFPDVHYFDVRRIICKGRTCSPYLDGRPIYYDKTHMSMDGSWLVGKHLVASSRGIPRVLDGIGPKSLQNAETLPVHLERGDELAHLEQEQRREREQAQLEARFDRPW